MSDSENKIWIADARIAASAIIAQLGPACERIEVAGSIRRHVSQVGDIEIVCRPLLSQDSPRSLSAVDNLLDELIPSGPGELSFEKAHVDSGLRWNTKQRANGTRYKRLIWIGQNGPLQEMKVDLFCVLPPASWGALLAIRTGPFDFSRGLVTKRSQGGAMPDDIAQKDGALWLGDEKIDTPEEEDYFRRLGVPYWLPEDRTAERLEEYLAGASPAEKE